MPRTDQFEQGFAVVRVDLFLFRDPMPDDWSDYVYVKEVWWTAEEAQAEVDRLNALVDDGGSRYHWQHVRVRRRSRSFVPSREHAGSEMVERLKNEVMSELVYEDDLGLWEPYWQVRTWMDRAKGERVEDDEAIAEQALRDLHNQGLIFLYRVASPEHPPDRPEPLPSSEARGEIAAAWWRRLPPEPGDVWISATPDGERSAKGQS